MPGLHASSDHDDSLMLKMFIIQTQLNGIKSLVHEVYRQCNTMQLSIILTDK